MSGHSEPRKGRPENSEDLIWHAKPTLITGKVSILRVFDEIKLCVKQKIWGSFKKKFSRFGLKKSR